MQHFSALEQVHLSTPSIVTIGVFDGVHRGHQYLIGRLRAQAAQANLTPVVLTFYPHPRMVLSGFQPGFYLTLPDDRARLLGEAGVEVVVTHPFDDEVRHIRAADFVDSLLEHLNMRALWVGEDFALGYQREGNVTFLRAQGQEKHFQLEAIDLMDAGDEHVSSSRIRASLAEGDVAEAARLLGRPHFVVGEVVEGARRGRTIGFPTANLSVSPELAVPAGGVYAAWAEVESLVRPSVVNIGTRPTFNGSPVTVIEAHLMDFSGDLYHRPLHLHFIQRLRDEQKFASVEELVAQIHRDAETGRELLGTTPPDFHLQPA